MISNSPRNTPKIAPPTVTVAASGARSMRLIAGNSREPEERTLNLRHDRDVGRVGPAGEIGGVAQKGVPGLDVAERKLAQQRAQMERDVRGC